MISQPLPFAWTIKLSESLLSLSEYGKSAILKNIKVYHIHTEGPGAYLQPECDGIFRVQNFFTAANARKAVNEGRADAIPVHLSGKLI